MVLSPDQIKSYREKCIEEINKGLTRKKQLHKTFDYDGGILALQTKSPVPNDYYKNQFKELNTPCYVLDCGGTNWKGAIVNLKKGQARISPRIAEITFANPNRRVRDSLEHFAEEIADLLYLLIGNTQRIIKSLAVVLGFPQINFSTPYGIEAKLFESQLTKGWYIKGDVNKPLGKVLLQILEDKYAIYVENIFFANDAASMMWDLSIDIEDHETLAPIGGVWGSGVNFGISINSRKWRGHIINTEIGRSKSLLTAQDYSDFEIMKKLGCPVPNELELETVVGGDYMFYLFMAKVLSAVIQEVSIPMELQVRFEELMMQKDTSHLLSEIVACTDLLEIEEILDLHEEATSIKILEIIKKSAEIVFDNASFKMALFLSSLIETVGLNPEKDWVIPIEGSVINEGFSIHDKFVKNLNDLLPEYSIRLATEASSLKALAILSSVLSK